MQLIFLNWFGYNFFAVVSLILMINQRLITVQVSILKVLFRENGVEEF